VRSDLPCDRKKILEFKNIESICIEILVGNNKWLISGVYRPQTINEFFFHRVLEGVAWITAHAGESPSWLVLSKTTRAYWRPSNNYYWQYKLKQTLCELIFKVELK
jgi:hypothetical protein